MAKKQNPNKGLIQVGPKLWAVDIYVKGQRIRKTVGSHSAAESFIRDQKKLGMEKKNVPELHRKRVTFDKLAKEYLEWVELRHKRNGDDASRVNPWIAAFGDIFADELKASQVESEIDRMKATTLKNGKTMAPATIARRLVVLKAIYNRAVRNEVLLRNPIAKVKPPKFDNTLVRYLTEEQEEKLFKQLSPRLHPLVTVALHTGCRQGELLALKWHDVDFVSGTFLLRDTKAGESRRIRMNSTVLKVLSECQGKEEAERQVFTDTLDQPMDARNLRRDFDKAVTKAGLQPFRFHDLRHTFASRLAMNGANDRTLQELLGHKTPRMILRYSHLGPCE